MRIPVMDDKKSSSSQNFIAVCGTTSRVKIKQVQIQPIQTPALKKRHLAERKSQKNTLAELLPGPSPPPVSTSASNIIAHNPFDDPMPANSMQGKLPQQMPQAQPGPQIPGQGPPPHGKVYPPNQPLVFNPSNPCAPPIYSCGVCHKEIHENDQAVLCESGCNFFFHRMCTGLTQDAFSMLKAEVYAEWVCDRCLTTKNIPLVKLKS